MWRVFAIGLALSVAAVICEAASDDFVNDGEGQQPSVARAVRPAKIGDMSTNMAPAIGDDAEGVTALLKSWRTSVDPAFFPCGLVWNDIPKCEQDGFIRRLEALPQ